MTSIAELKKVTVFFTGAQIQHEGKVELKPGKQEVVFQKLTDFIDPNTVQVKAMGDLTILSVRTKKNYEDQKISSEEINQLNAKRKALETKDQTLRDEYTILEMDKNLLMRNRDLKGYNEGLKTAELKEAYAFMHQKLSEITTRQSQIFDELEDLLKSMNKLEQEIISQRSKPVINYSEIVVEVDVEKATNATFVFNYISPRATWKPYYDMRSDGIGKPIRLEAKANVSQTTGIEWKNVDMVLSTNDPYQNAQEPTLNPWYLYYNNYPQQKTQSARSIPTVDYSGEKLRGEVIDASTGEPLPFTKITFWNFPNVGAVTDFDGKFEIT
ncbi:MAG: mucoidy inhibitor MuiA family protein, partial [Crocinitomicaceae bacterium]|nr:mucoidy inhibitor MuiA family protein [Crocinitomicaceae bacterium]